MCLIQHLHRALYKEHTDGWLLNSPKWLEHHVVERPDHWLGLNLLQTLTDTYFTYEKISLAISSNCLKDIMKCKHMKF
jgi:hypothetical protein